MFVVSHLYLYLKKTINRDNYLKVLEEAVEEMLEIWNLDTVYLQIDNARYHWTIDVVELYKENNIKVIDWLQYSPDLNPIKND